MYEGPYYCYYNWPRRLNPEDDKSVQEAYEILYEIIEQDGPFDGILGFSHGAALAFGFLAQHAKRRPHDPLFRCAIFVCALPPFRMDKSERIVYDEGLQGAVRIPTLHIAGREDFVLEHSKKLYALCSPGSAKLVFHSKGHEIPRNPRDVSTMAAGCRELMQRAIFGS